MSGPMVFEAPCQTLFLLEGDLVRVFGSGGTEATFPASDLEAFLDFLARRNPDPETPPGEPGPGLL
jgi:hypothetical protein